MSEPFVVAFVPGVTPGKWSRLWAERMRREPLELRPLDGDAALDALHDGTVDMALVRDVDAEDEMHVIPLYREQPVVVAPKDHPVTAFETVAIGDLGDEVILDGQGADTVELVAANVGVALMPQSVARAHSRRDVVARPVTGVPDTGIGLAWLRSNEDPRPRLHRDRARARRTPRADPYASSASSSRGSAAWDTVVGRRPEAAKEFAERSATRNGRCRWMKRWPIPPWMP